MPTNTLSPKRTMLKRAVLSSAAITLVVMAVLFGADFFNAQAAKGAKGHTAAASTNKNDLAIESLSKKIVAENQDHEALQRKQAELTSSIKEAPAFVLTPAERTHRKLVSQLIHLLALEKQSPEGSPEITATREQIDILQEQMAEMPLENAKSQGVIPAGKSPTEMQLETVNQQLSLNEAAIKTDVPKLDQLVRARNIADSLRQVPRDFSALIILIVSISFGLAAGLIMILSARFFSIQNEDDLRKVLPPTIQFLGSVPHMRATP